MKIKLIIAILLLSITVVVLIGAILFQVNGLVVSNQKIGSLMRISKLANSLRSTVYHYQLELWEYAFDPAPERLDAFNEVDKESTSLINAFTAAINSEDAIVYPGGIAYAKGVLSQVEQLTVSTQKVLTAADQYRKLRDVNSNISLIIKSQVALRQALFDCEKVFDDVKIDERVERFTSEQIEFGAQMGGQLIKATNLIQTLSVILAGLYLGLLIIIAIWLSTLITRFKKNKYGKS